MIVVRYQVPTGAPPPPGAHFHVIVNERGLQIPSPEACAATGLLANGTRRFTVRERVAAMAEADREHKQGRGVRVIRCTRPCLAPLAPQLPPHDPAEAPKD